MTASAHDASAQLLDQVNQACDELKSGDILGRAIIEF